MKSRDFFPLIHRISSKYIKTIEIISYKNGNKFRDFYVNISDYDRATDALLIAEQEIIDLKSIIRKNKILNILS